MQSTSRFTGILGIRASLLLIRYPFYKSVKTETVLTDYGFLYNSYLKWDYSWVSNCGFLLLDWEGRGGLLAAIAGLNLEISPFISLISPQLCQIR